MCVLKGGGCVCALGRVVCVCSRVGGVCVHEIGWCMRNGSMRARGWVVYMFVDANILPTTFVDANILPTTPNLTRTYGMRHN